MREPPIDVAPERLWRSLLAVPRATAPLSYRIPGLESTPLGVRALTSLEMGSAASWTEEGPPQVHASRWPQAVVAAALTVNGRPAFASPDEVGALGERELRELGVEVLRVLGRISPIYGRSDSDKWIAALVLGAKDSSNLMAAMTLGQSVDIAIGFSGHAITARPDRYFGVRAGELTDGHWFAYRAARRVIELAQGKNG